MSKLGYLITKWCLWCPCWVYVCRCVTVWGRFLLVCPAVGLLILSRPVAFMSLLHGACFSHSLSTSTTSSRETPPPLTPQSSDFNLSENWKIKQLLNELFRLSVHNFYISRNIGMIKYDYMLQFPAVALWCIHLSNCWTLNESIKQKDEALW